MLNISKKYCVNSVSVKIILQNCVLENSKNSVKNCSVKIVLKIVLKYSKNLC